MKYYTNIIKRKKLIKYCFFFCGEVTNAFKINFLFCNLIYKNIYSSEYRLLSIAIKKVLPLISHISNIGKDCLFVGTNMIYSKTILQSKANFFIKTLIYKKHGFLYNFFMQLGRIHNKWNTLRAPALLIMLSFEGTKQLLIESKKKAIPSVGLVTAYDNSNLIEYPIFVNRFFFHSVYFFVHLFFKLIVLYNNKK